MHDIDKIIEEQMKRWTMKTKSSQKPWPVISISREFGTSGAALGENIANHLKFSLWHKNILQKIAEQTGMSEDFLQTLDEQNRNELEDMISGALLGKIGTETEYVRQLYKAFKVIQHHGSSVVIGRGSQFILDDDKALKVRIVAPFDTRVALVEKREKWSKDKATKETTEHDQQRQKFHQHYYSKDVSFAPYYDLVINIVALSIDSASKVILKAYEEKFNGLPV